MQAAAVTRELGAMDYEQETKLCRAIGFRFVHREFQKERFRPSGTERYEYSPFGMVTKQAGGYAAINPFRFKLIFFCAPFRRTPGTYAEIVFAFEKKAVVIRFPPEIDAHPEPPETT